MAAACVLLYTLMVTCELVGGVQAPLSIVHRNTLVPCPKPVTPEVGLLGVVMVPAPDTSDHVPMAGATATLPAKVAVEAGWHRFWLGPALAAGWPGSYTLTVTSSDVVPHVA